MRQTTLATLAVTHFFVSPAMADQLVLDDLIVIDDLLCVGFSCLNGEPSELSFSILKIKDLNTAIKFEDTSTGNFPGSDWEITTNFTTEFGPNQFAIGDLTAVTRPFIIGGAAPTYSFYLDSVGDIGLGTFLPQEELHIVSSDGDAAVRFETVTNLPYSWEIGGNSLGFYVYDVTQSRIPFEIAPGAPSASAIIAADGNVGLGTASPDAPLEISDDASFSFFRITATGAPSTKSVDFVFTQGPLNTGELRYNLVDGDGPEMRLNANGDMTLTGTLTTTGPTCSGGCDRVFNPEFELASIEEHAVAMWEKGHLPALGPTLPGAPVNVTEKMGDMLNELEHAHIYIADLHVRLEAQEQLNVKLLERLDALEQRIPN